MFEGLTLEQLRERARLNALRGIVTSQALRDEIAKREAGELGWYPRTGARMIFQVWHRTVPNFMGSTPDILAAFPVGFTHVANVETDDVGRVFQLTNHICAEPFWENDGVTLTPDGDAARGPRSTSVGDVIVSGDRRWTIQGMGLGEF